MQVQYGTRTARWSSKPMHVDPASTIGGHHSFSASRFEMSSLFVEPKECVANKLFNAFHSKLMMFLNLLCRARKIRVYMILEYGIFTPNVSPRKAQLYKCIVPGQVAKLNILEIQTRNGVDICKYVLAFFP